MVTIRRILACSSRSKLTVVICALGLVLQGCHPARRDKNGHRPEEVAAAFILAVQHGDITQAAEYWVPGSIPNVEANFGVSFEEFCIREFKCDSYALSKAEKGKGPWYHVGFEGEVMGGDPKSFGLYLKLVEDEWRLGQDRWRDSDP